MSAKETLALSPPPAVPDPAHDAVGLLPVRPEEPGQDGFARRQVGERLVAEAVLALVPMLFDRVQLRAMVWTR